MVHWRELSELDGIAADEIPAALGAIERLKAVLMRRLLVPSPQPDPNVSYRSALDLAQRLDVSRSFLYAHASELGAVRLGKSIRFSEVKVRRYLEANGR